MIIKRSHLLHMLPVRLVLLGGLVGLLCGCHSMSLRGNPTIDAARFQQDPPRTLAILPPTDLSGHPKLRQALRRNLNAQLADCPYEARKSKLVDDFLATKAATRGLAPTQLAHDDMIDPRLADCVMFLQLDRVSRLYLLFYAHFRIDMNVTMVDTRTRQVVYQNHFSFYDRVYDFAGFTEGPVKALWHLRPQHLEESLEYGVKEIARQLPEPAQPDPPPFGAIRLSSVQGLTPQPFLSAGAHLEETY